MMCANEGHNMQISLRKNRNLAYLVISIYAKLA